MKKIGFLGGSFDPIHIGHLHLAISLLEAFDLDQVLFCPAACAPHKKEKIVGADPFARLEMVRLAIETAPLFALLDWEVVRGGVSYSVDTMRALVKERPGNQFFLLLGEDSFSQLDTWKEKNALIDMAPAIVGSRKEFNVSSTDVRLRLSQKKYCGHLVPEKVLDYIARHGLYSSS